MKKIYSKPLLAVEMFTMVQSIARDCADNIPKDQLTNNNVHNCVWDLGDGTTVFVGGSTCLMDGEEMGIACYNNPTENNLIFKS